LNKYSRVFFLAVAVAAVVYLVARNISSAGNILIVIIGFGAVVLAHEFGHFIVAKLSDIKVEVFSIGFPPTLAGIQRTGNGYRIRILPGFFPAEDNGDSDGCLFAFTIGKSAKPGETEYRIGLIPFGGFVKMLGQEDTKDVQQTDDPRSYTNKPVSTRMAVIAAGVIFNAISAVIIFITVFLVGINLAPPIIGGVIPNSPAAMAGLKAGDEVIEIDGESDSLDFSSIGVAAALSPKGEKIKLKVKHENNSTEEFAVIASQSQSAPLRVIGVLPADTLTVHKLSADDAGRLFAKTALCPGDRIKAVNGQDVQTLWQFEQIVRDVLAPTVTVAVERVNQTSKKTELVESKLSLDLTVAGKDVNSESDLTNIYSMVPRMRIVAFAPDETLSIKGKLSSLLDKISRRKNKTDAGPSLQAGDIVLAIGDVENPTYTDMRSTVEEYENKELPVRVLRPDVNGTDKILTVTTVPKCSADGRVLIGIAITLDAEHPVVAKTIDTKSGQTPLLIPRGAAITAVGGVKVSSFYDVISEIRRNAGKKITIDWQLGDKEKGTIDLNVDSGKNSIAGRSLLSEAIPFKPLERLYRAAGPAQAVKMGYNRTIMFIAQSLVTLQRLFGGHISAKNFMGPVGIFTFGYRIVADKPIIYYVYFLGLISACIAVFNSLPLLPFDGGHIVFLLAEKIKGSPVNERVQTIAIYTGMVLVGTLFLYVTFNDVVRSFFQ